MTDEQPIDKLEPEERRTAFLQATAYLIVPAATIILFVVAAIVGLAAWRVDAVARDTNRIVRVEVGEKDTQIARQQFVIDRQAVPAIVYMIEQLQAAGIEPPQILLGAQHPPFRPPSDRPGS